MKKAYYIDSMLNDTLEKVSPATRREANFSFGIARRIYDVLKKKGWSKTDLAKATGKKTPVVTRWMSGNHNFTMRTIAEIETALGEDILSVKQDRRSRHSTKQYHIPEETLHMVSEGDKPKYTRKVVL